MHRTILNGKKENFGYYSDHNYSIKKMLNKLANHVLCKTYIIYNIFITGVSKE